MVHNRTRTEFRQWLNDQGLSATEWARMHRYSSANVLAILNDDEAHPRIRCIRGEAHNIAVSMGLKRGTVSRHAKSLLAA